MTKTLFSRNVIVLTAICIVTFCCFSYTLHNQFTNWDDDFYVTNDPYIRSFSASNLSTIFREDITKNNYHPLCMLSLAVNYHFAKLDPWSYYLTNILIHIANVILVFFLLMQLCVRLKVEDIGKLFIAGFGALWFGIHPMRVESVSWIAERKDVLYAFFYFAGLLGYLKYLDTGKMKWYWLTYVLFAASCLSKPMAVVFPLSLICVDLLMRRKLLSKKVILEKVLFFASSFACGFYAYWEQNKTGAVASFSAIPLAERFMYASYGYIMYISKLFNPTYLSTFYPYPYRYKETGMLHPIFYAAPFLAAASIIVPLYITYKFKRAYFSIVAFGMGFFVVNVMFVLQFLSVGAAIMADRYSYVAYFGLIFLLFYFLNELRLKFKSISIVMVAILLLASGALAYGCYQRTFVWHDSLTLLSDAIEKYPLKKDPDTPHDSKNSGVALLSYKWRGNYYMAKGELDSALSDYQVLVLLRQQDPRVFDNVGVIYRIKKDYKKALEIFDLSLQMQNNMYKTYLDRSMTYLRTGDSGLALKDYVTALQLNSNSEKILFDSSFQSVQKKEFDNAIAQFNMMLNINTSNSFYYFYRGVALYGKGMIEPAVADWEVAVKFDVKDTKQSASNNLSVAYDGLGKDSLAVYYAEMAIASGYKVTPEFLATLKEKAKTQSKANKK